MVGGWGDRCRADRWSACHRIGRVVVVGFVDPCLLRQAGRTGSAGEPFGVCGPRLVEGALTLGADEVAAIYADLVLASLERAR